MLQREKKKEGGLSGATNSLARLSRKEVGLAKLAIATVSDEQIREGWNKLRHSAMLLSNRLPADVKVSKVDKQTYFGGLYQKVVITR